MDSGVGTIDSLEKKMRQQEGTKIKKEYDRERKRDKAIQRKKGGYPMCFELSVEFGTKHNISPLGPWGTAFDPAFENSLTLLSMGWEALFAPHPAVFFAI